MGYGIEVEQPIDGPASEHPMTGWVFRHGAQPGIAVLAVAGGKADAQAVVMDVRNLGADAPKGFSLIWAHLASLAAARMGPFNF